MFTPHTVVVLLDVRRRGERERRRIHGVVRRVADSLGHVDHRLQVRNEVEAGRGVSARPPGVGEAFVGGTWTKRLHAAPVAEHTKGDCAVAVPGQNRSV